MKKIFIVIITLIILLSSCDRVKEELILEKANANAKPSSNHWEHTGGIWGSVDYRIVEKTIDSCQYIIIFGTDSRNIIHKANCRNPYCRTQK